MPEMAEVCMDY